MNNFSSSTGWQRWKKRIYWDYVTLLSTEVGAWVELFYSQGQVPKVYSPKLSKEKCISDLLRNYSIIIFHLNKLWKAKVFILCDVLFLVRLLYYTERSYIFRLYNYNLRGGGGERGNLANQNARGIVVILCVWRFSSTLTVTLIRMGDLPRRDTGHPPDVLIEMQIRYAYDDKIKSETYQANCNPHMYESFRFEIPHQDLGNQTLFFNVIDMMETNLPPPPTPPEVPKSRWGKPPPLPPPPPPPSPTQIGISTVPLVSVPMKKLMSDTELSIVRDVIKIKRKPIVPSAPQSPGPELAVVTEDLAEVTPHDNDQDAEVWDFFLPGCHYSVKLKIELPRVKLRLCVFFYWPRLEV